MPPRIRWDEIFFNKKTFLQYNFHTKINKFLSRLRESKSPFIRTKNTRYEKHFCNSLYRRAQSYEKKKTFLQRCRELQKCFSYLLFFCAYKRALQFSEAWQKFVYFCVEIHTKKKTFLQRCRELQSSYIRTKKNWKNETKYCYRKNISASLPRSTEPVYTQKKKRKKKKHFCKAAEKCRACICTECVLL